MHGWTQANVIVTSSLLLAEVAMRVSVQVVIESPDGSPVTTEIACLDRGELEAGSLGLHLSEAKSILEGLQRSMVDAQVAACIVRASARRSR